MSKAQACYKQSLFDKVTEWRVLGRFDSKINTALITVLTEKRTIRCFSEFWSPVIQMGKQGQLFPSVTWRKTSILINLKLKISEVSQCFNIISWEKKNIKFLHSPSSNITE